MRPALFPLLLSLPLLVQAAAVATTKVHFSHPENFTDAHLDRDYGRGASEFVLQELRQYIEQLGERHLQPGQRLTVEVRDIDLAGRFEPWRAEAYHVRFMREITWPRIKLHYRLEQDGRELVSREAVVLDQGYLQHPSRYPASDRLRYEKAMLADWFRRNIGKPTQRSRS